MESILLKFIIKDEVVIKEEILDFTNNELENKDGEQYMMMNKSNENQIFCNLRGSKTQQYQREFTSEKEEKSKIRKEILNRQSENVSKDAQKQFPCHICNYGTDVKGNLKRHLSSVHSDLKPFKCSYCESRFTVKSLLKSHLDVHIDLRPFKCCQCDFAFKRLDELRKHKLVHSDIRLFKCSYCELAFKRMGELKRHKLVHSDLKPFKCSHCELTFKRKDYFKKHTLLHTNIRPRTSASKKL